MRVEPHGVHSVMHVIQRGARGHEIVRDAKDRNRFLRCLYYLNDMHADPNWPREVARLTPPERPVQWPERVPLVRILGWTLLTNHFHLLLQEIQDGGIAKFMQRLGGSMSTYFNTKYREKGSLFQGGYRGVIVDAQAHLQYVVFYILVKNVLDVYPGGLQGACKDFNMAWDWAGRYSYSSLRDYFADDFLPICDDPDGLVRDVISNIQTYKQEARELLNLHLSTKGEDFALQMLEPW